MRKLLFFLFVYIFPFALLADELPTEVKRPAIDTYRHTSLPPYIAKPEGINGNYRKMTISPKALPDPLLRYRVNIFATEKETGNAYPLYVAALKEFHNRLQQAMTAMYQSETYRKLDPDKEGYQQEIEKLQFKAFPLYSYWGMRDHPEITAEEEAGSYQSLNEVYRLMEKASKKTYYDWGDTYEYKGIATNLGHLQEARTLTRYLVDKANWEIRNGKYDDATRTICVGLAHADHILESRPPSFLVGMLVGTALESAMHEQLFQLAAQPGAPNLYPALMQLTKTSRPWLDAMQSETLFLLPKHSDNAFWESQDSLSPDQAENILDELCTMLFIAFDGEFIKDTRSMTMTAAALTSYLPAKQRLLQKGFSEEAIEALTTYQIVAPFVFEELKRAYDLMLVEASMPVGETHTSFQFDEYVMDRHRNPRSPSDFMVAMLMPATLAAQSAFHRQQQTLDLLKIVEAICYSAAVHGKLPASLDEITELAVPKICPITAKPYGYHSSGRTAVIDYNFGHRGGECRIDITVE